MKKLYGHFHFICLLLWIGIDKESALFILHMEDSPLVPGTLLVGPAQCKPEFQWISNSLQEFKSFCKARWKQINKKDQCLVGRVSSVVESRVAKERRVLGFNWCDCRIFSKENTWDGKGLREQDSQINLRSKVKKSQEGRCHLHGHRGREAGEEERQVEE